MAYTDRLTAGQPVPPYRFPLARSDAMFDRATKNPASAAGSSDPRHCNEGEEILRCAGGGSAETSAVLFSCDKTTVLPAVGGVDNRSVISNIGGFAVTGCGPAAAQFPEPGPVSSHDTGARTPSRDSGQSALPSRQCSGRSLRLQA